jgi:hypothetical protein
MTADLPRDELEPRRRARIEADPEQVERGLVQLVLTLVELLRQLMERQAIRRVENPRTSTSTSDRSAACSDR